MFTLTTFLIVDQPRLLLLCFCLFVYNILVASRIQTRIVGVEGEVADHLTTATTADTLRAFYC